MKKLIYLSVFVLFNLCLISCEKDISTHTHECNSCGTEQCECSHNEDTKDNVCAVCGMENCTMSCSSD